jgi:hypothetical protein
MQLFFCLKNHRMLLELKVPFPNHDYCQKHGLPLTNEHVVIQLRTCLKVTMSDATCKHDTNTPQIFCGLVFSLSGFMSKQIDLLWHD